MRVLALTLALVGCSGQPSGDDGTHSGTPGPDSSTPTDTGAPTGTLTEDTSASLVGTVSDASGPRTGVDLRLCRGLACRNGTTEAGGAFSFTDVAVDWYSFEVVPPEGFATAFAPLQFESQTERSIDVTLVAAESHPLPASRSDVEVAPGVHLSVGQGDLDPPTPFDPAPTAITGAPVPEALWVPVDGVPGTVVGMWYLGPFDTPAASSSGVPVSFDDAWSLPDATTLHVWVASYETSSWVDAGTVTASGGVLSGDAALPLLSTVILVQD